MVPGGSVESLGAVKLQPMEQAESPAVKKAVPAVFLVDCVSANPEPTSLYAVSYAAMMASRLFVPSLPGVKSNASSSIVAAASAGSVGLQLSSP